LRDRVLRLGLPFVFGVLALTMQLRYLGTLFDIAGEHGSTIVFPFPIELVHALSAPAPKGS
jgi:hypothetical protein